MMSTPKCELCWKFWTELHECVSDTHADYATLEAECRLYAQLVVESWQAHQPMMDLFEFQRAQAWLDAHKEG